MLHQNNGAYKIPVLGLGTFMAKEKEELENTLNEALKLGYRHIDTAAMYENEEIIGNVLKEWISSGKINREELFITTKLSPFEMEPEKVENALKTSLGKLQLDYVDLYLIHVPFSFNNNEPTDFIGIWKKMEELVDAGKARTIGISNFNIAQIKKIQNNARIQPANLQVEVHLFFQQDPLREFAHKNNIAVVAFAPLGNPGVSNFKYDGEQKFHAQNILGDKDVLKIAQKHKKTAAQIAIRFLIQLGLVTIPKSSSPKRVKENFEVFDFELDNDDMKILKSLDKGESARIFNLANMDPKFAEHPDYPYKHSH